VEWGFWVERLLPIFSTIVWGIVPPLLLLLFYHQRVRAAPPVNGLVLLFSGGMLVGVVAQGLNWLVEHLMGAIAGAGWLQQTALGLLIYQLAVVATIAEGCKLLAVVLPILWLLRRYQRLPAQPSTVVLATIAVASGFAAQDNLITLWRSEAPVINTVMTMPLQVWFSIPWGLGLGIGLCRTLRHVEYSHRLTLHGWLLACVCHAGWNWLWLISQQVSPLGVIAPWLVMVPHQLRYGLFTGCLWLWWQTEVMLARSQQEPVPRLITAMALRPRLGQYAMAVGALIIGGMALYSLRNFVHSLEVTWALRMTFDRATGTALWQALLRTIILGVAAIYLFCYLRSAIGDRR
jgi:hypothetical protein